MFTIRQQRDSFVVVFLNFDGRKTERHVYWTSVLVKVLTQAPHFN